MILIRQKFIFVYIDCLVILDGHKLKVKQVGKKVNINNKTGLEKGQHKKI